MSFIFDGRAVASDQEFIDTINQTTMENHTGCWLWLGRTTLGYGKVRFSTPTVKGDKAVHRESYRIFIGEIPEGLLIRHRCHNKLCCNPLHLEPGTDRDNWLDMLVDGHTRLLEQDGEANISSKLTEQDVYKIREMFKTGQYSATELSEVYGVARRCIERTVVGVAYSCYQDVPPYDWRDLPVNIFRGRLTRQGKAQIEALQELGLSQIEIVKTTEFTRKMVNRVVNPSLSHTRI